jgi:hypothetical protein
MTRELVGVAPGRQAGNSPPVRPATHRCNPDPFQAFVGIRLEVPARSSHNMAEILRVLRAVVNPTVVIPKLSAAVNDAEVDQRTLRFIGSLDADCTHAEVLCCLDVE